MNWDLAVRSAATKSTNVDEITCVMKSALRQVNKGGFDFIRGNMPRIASKLAWISFFNTPRQIKI